MMIDDSDAFLAHPQSFVPKIYDKAYVGGFTAAEHWGLTGESSRKIHVFTFKAQDEKEIEGVSFSVQVIPEVLFFGFESVGAGDSRYFISDPEKTLIDSILYPSAFGGKDIARDMIEDYCMLPQRNIERLLKYAVMTKNPTVKHTVKTMIGGQP